MSETKTLTGVKVKDAEKGQVEAVFSTFNVKDHDGDVTLPDAFTDGQPVRISAYGHASHGGALPVGKGALRVTDTGAVLDGQFFLSTSAGRDTFETVKEMGDLQEWSYGYETLKSSTGDFEGEEVNFLEELRVIEVSPVLQGAGINTRTLVVKNEKPAFSDEVERILGDLNGLIGRAKAFGSQSAKAGRPLSAANRERLTNLLSALDSADEFKEEIRQLLADTDPNKGREMLMREFLAFQHTLTL